MTREADDIHLPDDSADEYERGFPICPLGLPQVARECLGFYERGPAYLQLRFGALDNQGLCDLVFEEGPSMIAVRLVLCSKEDEPFRYLGLAEERTHVCLEAPLGDRIVMDLETGRPVPFFVPTYDDNRPTKAPGYYTDKDEALAAWELGPDGAEQTTRIHGGLGRYRTLGY